MQVFSRLELEPFLNDYKDQALGAGQASKMRCVFDDDHYLWNLDLIRGFLTLDQERPFSPHVLDALNMCGAMDTTVSFASDSKDINSPDWKTWFLAKVADKDLVFDTNFILHHYFSSLLSTKLKPDEISRLTVYLPRMVVLEIERRGNEKDNRRNNEANVGAIAGKDKRLSFYASKEIYDMRKLTKFSLIPLYDRSLMIEFSDRAGKGFSDMWIRREIHDLLKNEQMQKRDVVFVTCDLMNSMAAEAEGLTSCYFSRLPKEDFNIYRYPKQFFDFLIANAVIFERIKIELLTIEGNMVGSYYLQGTWHGKTTSEWYSDCMRRIQLNDPDRA